MSKDMQHHRDAREEHGRIINPVNDTSNSSDSKDSIRKASVQTNSDDEEHQGRRRESLKLTHTHTRKLLRMRALHDHDPTDWWFASTAIPLVAATFAPMANMLSIAALVVPWRNNIANFDDPAMKYALNGQPDILDPDWCLRLNAISLMCGFLGNLFLLFNFTRRVRYIIALPVTIVFFYLASAILIGIVVAMDEFTPPTDVQVYSQAYWHAVIASILYMLNGMILMVNMFGYFRGHYPQHFALTDEQRNLILQTMLFFLWLGGGAGVFTATQGWSYPDALYFCDVTILTIGFGDFYATTDVGRGLVFPFSVGGTIILGLMVSSLHKFARELSKEKVVRRHIEKRRVNTLSRAITMDELDDKQLNMLAAGQSLQISHPSQQDQQKIQHDLEVLAREAQAKRVLTFQDDGKVNSQDEGDSKQSAYQKPTAPLPDDENATERRFMSFPKRALTFPLVRTLTSTSTIRRSPTRNGKRILMLEERDRFNAMRSVQVSASRFNRYYALTMSIVSFGMLWCLGAMVFYFAEQDTQQLSYFQGLYFCYVSLLTIGYGDLSPKSNAGKAFFVVWSLIAVPTMTILVSDLGDTVIGGFKRGVLQNDLGLTSSSRPEGRFMSTVHRLFPSLASDATPPTKSTDGNALAVTETTNDVEKAGPLVDREEMQQQRTKTIDELVNNDVDETEMMRSLAFAIRKVADDLKKAPGKKYQYEEWVEFTRLIRFSKLEANGTNDAIKELEDEEGADGVVEWDWLDENSPMASDQSESEWLLDRLCESLLRIFKRGDLLSRLLETHCLEPNKARYVSTADSDPPADINIGGREYAQPDEREDGPRSAVTQFLQGDHASNSLPQWSKRAHARMAAVDQTVRERRRSSTSIAKRRRGPFAILGSKPRISADDGTRTLKARAMYGSDVTKRDGL